MERNEPLSGGRRGTRSSRSSRRGSEAILLLAQTPEACPSSDASVFTGSAFGYEEDDIPFADDGELHPGANTQALACLAWKNQLILA
jgi:hypothetical protein